MTGDWRDRAACRGEDLAVFYPNSGESSTEAARICQACPVQAECLEEALRLRDTHGYRGGRTADERARMLRRDPTRALANPLSADDVAALLGAGWTCPAIAARLDVHVDSVRRVRRRLLKEQGVAA